MYPRIWSGLLGMALLVALVACGSSPPMHGAASRAEPPRAATAVPRAAAETPAPADGGIIVHVVGMRFQPEEVQVKAGGSVTWLFEDSNMPHTATAFDGSFDSGVYTAGSFTLRFDAPGTVCYQCVVHPGANLCRQTGSPVPQLPLLLTGEGAVPAGDGVDALPSMGGGHMQGKVTVVP